MLFVIENYFETIAGRKILIQIETKADKKLQFTSVNEGFEEDCNEELGQKMSFAKVSFLERWIVDRIMQPAAFFSL